MKNTIVGDSVNLAGASCRNALKSQSPRRLTTFLPGVVGGDTIAFEPTH